MKKNIILAFLLAFFYSCSWEQELEADESIDPQTRAIMQVEITENSAQGADKIKTIRFIVFTNLTSMPKVEKNEFYDEADFVVEHALEQIAASKVKIVLELGRRVNRPNEKLVVAIVNEPSAMTGILDAVGTPEELANLELDMVHFVNEDHLSLKTDVMMPMSGAIWTDDSDMYATEEDAGNHSVLISLQRAVARVDVYMDTDMPGGLQIAAGSYITLDNTYTRSYFVRHEDQTGHVFGNIRTVAADDLTQKSWLAAGQVDIPYKTPSSAHVCTFYTPERDCDSGRLRLEVGVKSPEDDGVKSGGITLDMINDGNNTAHPVDMIRRNRIYKVTVTIGVNGITAIVRDWNGEEITTDL